MKRLLSILLTLAMLWTGISFALAETLEELPATEWDAEYDFLKTNQEPVTLRMYVNAPNFDATTWGLDAYSRWLERETGIKLEFDFPAALDDQKINLMIATDDLPDLIFFPDHTVPALGTLMNEDYLYPLEELIDQYAPAFREVSIYKNNRDYYEWEQNGTLYYIPCNAYDRALLENKDTVILSGTGYYCREDIWKALGEPPMDTWEKVEKVLYEVKEKYPEITNPLILWDAYSHYNIDGGTSMIYRSLGGKYKYILNDDVITSQARDPIYLEALFYINKLIKDGIIGMADFADESTKALEAANMNGEIFMSAGPGWRIINGETGVKKINPEWGYMGLDHMAKESVGHFFNPHYNLDGFGGALVIAKSTEHPDRAIQLYEFLATDQTQANVNKGVQGLHWEFTGPTNRFIASVGKAADIMFQEGYLEWQKYTGGNKYRWVGSVYYDSACARGDGLSDPIRKRIFEIEAVVDDFSDFTNIDPMPGTDEALINTKVNDLWKSYVGKVVLEATSFEDAQKIWNEFLEKADQQGFPKLEAFWTAKYHELQQIKAEGLNK